MGGIPGISYCMAMDQSDCLILCKYIIIVIKAGHQVHLLEDSEPWRENSSILNELSTFSRH